MGQTGMSPLACGRVRWHLPQQQAGAPGQLAMKDCLQSLIQFLHSVLMPRICTGFRDPLLQLAWVRVTDIPAGSCQQGPLPCALEPD